MSDWRRFGRWVRMWLRDQVRWRTFFLALYLAVMFALGPDRSAIIAFFTVMWMIVTYHMVYPWWTTEVGRNIMSLALCVEGFLSLRMLTIMYGENFYARDVLRTLMFALIALIFVIRVSIMLRAQIDPARHVAYQPPAPPTPTD